MSKFPSLLSIDTCLCNEVIRNTWGFFNVDQIVECGVGKVLNVVTDVRLRTFFVCFILGCEDTVLKCTALCHSDRDLAKGCKFLFK